jgi:hypothetical protein
MVVVHVLDHQDGFGQPAGICHMNFSTDGNVPNQHEATVECGTIHVNSTESECNLEP